MECAKINKISSTVIGFTESLLSNVLVSLVYKNDLYRKTIHLLLYKVLIG